MFSSILAAIKFIGALVLIMFGLCALFLFLGLLVREWRLECKIVKPARPELPPMPPLEFCPGCKAEIDPDCCWCGDAVATHNPYNDGHSPVPMGCVCHYREIQ